MKDSGNMIIVDKYFFEGPFNKLVLDEYNRMIDWVTERISPPMQDYDRLLHGSAIGRCGGSVKKHMAQ
jgi:hypothetical protein